MESWRICFNRNFSHLLDFGTEVAQDIPVDIKMHEEKAPHAHCQKNHSVSACTFTTDRNLIR